jgi:carbamate kinase
MRTCVIALGGNALLRAGQTGTYGEQLENVTDTCRSLMKLIKQDYLLVIGHGNGPQVGNVMLQQEAGKQIFDVERQPLDFCVSETQGSIGYLIEMGLRNSLLQEQIRKNVVSLITQVLVDKNDPMFQNPTKPVGPYYTEDEAYELMSKTNALFREDPKGNGWRKVVASPKPLKVMNIELVERLVSEGNIVITVGGGGIPITQTADGILQGVEAVIDKDLACALTAVAIKADEFYILTDVPKVYINFKKENEQQIDIMTVAEAKQYLVDGQFTEGSMAPKVRAAIYFVENGGKECIITEAHQLGNPNCGTRVIE